MASLWLTGYPSPFSLPEPSREWQDEILRYDGDLRLFPSQKDPGYRLMRVAKMSGGMSPDVFEKAMAHLHLDTKIAMSNGLVAVTTVPPGAITAPASLVVDWLKAHDLWAAGGADAASRLLEDRDAAKEARIDAGIRDEGRQRHIASRAGFQYRTGSRVSMVAPPSRTAPVALASAGTPGD